MVRLAVERLSDLFALAEREAPTHPELSDRYVVLARRIGMRYNVRLLPEYAELYCRGCAKFWVEGRTVRTRLRAGLRVRTCLRCGRVRRVPYRPRREPTTKALGAGRPATVGEEALLGPDPSIAPGGSTR